MAKKRAKKKAKAEVKPVHVDVKLADYDIIAISTSAGKDSQAMMDVVYRQAVEEGVTDRLIAIHADLGRCEWEGTKELAEEQARHYGIDFVVVRRELGDLLDHIEERGKFPTSCAQFCTASHKRDQINKHFTGMVNQIQDERGNKDQVRILSCIGIRAQESSKRSKAVAFKNDKRTTNGKRHCDIWHPIFTMTEDEVWETIRKSGVRYHEAYDLGMPRLSCCFCVFAPRNALLLAGHHNTDLLRQYVEVEERIGFTFTQKIKLADILADVEAGVQPGEIKTFGSY